MVWESNVYTSDEFLKQLFQNIWKILSSPEFLLALTNTSSPKRRGLLIAGGVSLVLTLTVIGIGIGVGLYLGSSDGTKPMQNETVVRDQLAFHEAGQALVQEQIFSTETGILSHLKDFAAFPHSCLPFFMKMPIAIVNCDCHNKKCC